MSGYLMLVVGVLLFALLSFANYRVAKSWLYPPAAMSGMWLLVFIALCFASSWLYPVSGAALGIFVSAVIFYSLGAYVVFKYPGSLKVDLAENYCTDYWLLMVLLVALVGGLPLFITHVEELTGQSLFSPEFFLKIRQANLLQSWSGARAPLIDNLVILSTITAFIAMFVSAGVRRHRWIVLAAIAISFIYNLLTGAKVGFASLTFGLIVIYLLRNGRFGVKLIYASALFLVGFGWLTVARVEAAEQYHLAAFKAIGLTARTLLLYLTVSPVAFGIYITHQAEIPAVRSIWFFFQRTANYFGDYFRIPPQHNPYVAVGPGLSYNTYTAYFTYYPDYGIFGVVLIMLLIGGLSAWAYKAARNGSFIWTLVFTYLLYGACMTVFNESLFLNLNFFFKLLAVAFVFVVARQLRITRHNRQQTL